MAWASVATKISSKATTKLIIKYNNITNKPNTKTKKEDDIPRHREITPDPADDFIMTNKPILIINTNKDYWPDWDEEWIDYTKDPYLNAFKQTLPYTLQEIARFARRVKVDKQVINLNFRKIQRDLQSLCTRYQDDKQTLKKLFYPYNPAGVYDYRYYHMHRESDDYDKRYDMLFDTYSATPVHYLLGKILDLKYRSDEDLSIKNTIKLIKQILKLIGLLIKYCIIDLHYVYIPCNEGEFIWDVIKLIPVYLKDKKYLKYIINDLADLFVLCVNKTSPLMLLLAYIYLTGNIVVAKI